MTSVPERTCQVLANNRTRVVAANDRVFQVPDDE